MKEDMAEAKIARKRWHADCGGEIEFILLEESVQTKVVCKKCGETEMQDYLTSPQKGREIKK
jgi:hypothetical protein